MLPSGKGLNPLAPADTPGLRSSVLLLLKASLRCQQHSRHTAVRTEIQVAMSTTAHSCPTTGAYSEMRMPDCVK